MRAQNILSVLPEGGSITSWRALALADTGSKAAFVALLDLVLRPERGDWLVLAQVTARSGVDGG